MSISDFTRNPADLTVDDLHPFRPTVGNQTPVVLWRLMRLIGLHEILEGETATVTFYVGKHVGKKLPINSIDDLQKVFTELKLGVITMPVQTDSQIHVGIGECVTCAGITPPLGMPICQFEAGIVVGALERIFPDKKVTGEETKCIGGLGDPLCLVECSII
ncbi:MAG TPA: DUF2507 domain-containing protein [Candidatus Paceibacterota bacterium]